MLSLQSRLECLWNWESIWRSRNY